MAQLGRGIGGIGCLQFNMEPIAETERDNADFIYSQYGKGIESCNCW